MKKSFKKESGYEMDKSTPEYTNISIYTNIRKVHKYTQNKYGSQRLYVTP